MSCGENVPKLRSVDLFPRVKEVGTLDEARGRAKLMESVTDGVTPRSKLDVPNAADWVTAVCPELVAFPSHDESHEITFPCTATSDFDDVFYRRQKRISATDLLLQAFQRSDLKPSQLPHRVHHDRFSRFPFLTPPELAGPESRSLISYKLSSRPYECSQVLLWCIRIRLPAHLSLGDSHRFWSNYVRDIHLFHVL